MEALRTPQLLPYRQRYYENTSPSLFGIHQDVAAHVFYDQFDDVEAEAGAVDVFILHVLGAEEFGEDAGLGFQRYAVARVRHADV